MKAAVNEERDIFSTRAVLRRLRTLWPRLNVSLTTASGRNRFDLLRKQMASVREEVDSFHRYAAARLANGGPDPSFEELLIEWQARHEQESVDEAVRRGMADIEAGRFRPADEVTESIRERFGFSK